jgi:hypothetical protein
MKFPKWSLLVFPVLAFLLICMFPVPAIVVAVLVAPWVVIAAQKASMCEAQMKSVTHPPDKELGGVGEWFAFLAVWCVAVGMALAIVCVLLGRAE